LNQLIDPLFVSLEELVSHVGDGMQVAVPADYSGCAMAATYALIRRGVRDLHLIGVPQTGLQADLLIGAGCVSTIETSAVSLGEHGLAPRFSAAVTSGAVAIKDSTCPAIHAGLLAAEKGVPFMPLRGVIGSDLVSHRDDWKVIGNPYAEDDDPIMLFPAIRPDVALFHAPFADRTGNVWIGVRRELMSMAHAAKMTLVTVESLTQDNLLADDKMAAGTIPALYVTSLAEVEHGAWPLGLRGHYSTDQAHLAQYVEMAATEEGFSEYLNRYVGAAHTGT